MLRLLQPQVEYNNILFIIIRIIFIFFYNSKNMDFFTREDSASILVRTISYYKNKILRWLQPQVRALELNIILIIYINRHNFANFSFTVNKMKTQVVVKIVLMKNYYNISTEYLLKNVVFISKKNTKFSFQKSTLSV